MDNVIKQEQKARWGFGGNASKIEVAPRTVGETGGVETVEYKSSEEGARHNGGGSEPVKGKRGRKSKKVAPEDQE